MLHPSLNSSFLMKRMLWTWNWSNARPKRPRNAWKSWRLEAKQRHEADECKAKRVTNVKPAADVAEVKQVANVKPAVDVEAQKRAGKWGWGEVKKQPTSKGKGQLVPEVHLTLVLGSRN